jgi:hypothetical protein
LPYVLSLFAQVIDQPAIVRKSCKFEQHDSNPSQAISRRVVGLVRMRKISDFKYQFQLSF